MTYKRDDKVFKAKLAASGFAHKPLIRRVFLCSLLGFCAVVLLTLEAACSKSLPSGHFVVNVRPNANYNQSEGKYSEDKIAYYLCCFGVSLIPVGILIVVGAHIYFWGDRCFRFLGDLLVFGGLAYLGLCALVLGVLRVVWN